MFSLGRFPNAGLRQYSLAGAKLAYVNAADKRQGNFTQRAGASCLLQEAIRHATDHALAHCNCHMTVLLSAK